MLSDLRIPVVFGSPFEAGPKDVLLTASDTPGAAASFAPGTGHAPGCTCCAPRGEAGRALARLLHARARGEIPFFNRVIAVLETDTARAEMLAALEADPVASMCFKKG